MDRKPRNVTYNLKTLLIATVITMLVLGTLGCIEKKMEWSFGEEWYWRAGTEVRSVAVGDVDGDGVPELITGGDGCNEVWYTLDNTTYQGPCSNGLLRIWHWTGTALALEHREGWSTVRGVWVYSVAVGDVDGDGVPELITGGLIHDKTRHYKGQLRIWRWMESILTLEQSEEWLTGDHTEVRSVAVGDVDGDGVPELITGGLVRNGLHTYGQLRIWHWSSAALTLEWSEEWLTGDHTVVLSVGVGDVDGDDVPELITGGRTADGIHLKGQLRIWRWTGTTLTLEQSEEWATRGDTYVRSVGVGDVDGDGVPELITGGRARGWTRIKGQLRIWRWTGAALHLEQSEEWATRGDTAVWSVGVGDVDGDGVPELITGGFAHVGSHLEGQLRIWHWTESTLTLEQSEEWTTDGDTTVWSVGVGDVDGDGVPELITGGVVGTADRGIITFGQPPPEVTPLKSQLRVWHWTGATLILAHSKEWATVAKTQIQAVHGRDVDANSIPKAIISVISGQTFDRGLLESWGIREARGGHSKPQNCFQAYSAHSITRNDETKKHQTLSI